MRTERNMKRLAVLLLMGAAVAFAQPSPQHVLRLSPAQAGAKKTYRFPDGTVLSDTVFYSSKASNLAVGRVDLNGPLMPRETANYTDMFMVAHGSGTLVEASGKTHRLVAGDFVLLPHGLTFEMRDSSQYIHYFASFERGKGIAFNGPIALQVLRPARLRRTDYVDDSGGKRHTYYQGQNGVNISSYCYAQRTRDRSAPRAYSELMFVVSGRGAIREAGQTTVAVTPGAAIFIPKDADIGLEATNLCTVSVRFDQMAP